MTLTKVHNRMISGSFINVKDFGAVGDGVTDDTSAINAAMASASSIVVYFPTGTYLHTGLSVANADSITVFGDGATLFLANGSNATCLYFNTCDYVTVQGLTVDGNQTNQVISGSRLNGAGVYVLGATHANICGNIIKNISTGASILLGSSDPFAASTTSESCVVENNVIKNSGYVGAAFTCDAIYSQIDNSIISGNRIFSGTDYGVALEYSKRSHVTNNAIYDVEVGCGGVGVDSCIYSDNTLTDCLFGGILFNTAGQAITSPWISYRTVVSNNVIKNTGGSSLPGDNHGILVSYQNVQTDFVVNNNLVDGADYCISIDTNGVVLDGNTAKNASLRGILIDGDAYVDVFDNRVDTNASPNLSTVKYGSVRDTSSYNLQARTFRGNSGGAGVTYRPCYLKTDDASGNKSCIVNVYATSDVSGVGLSCTYRQMSIKSVAGTLTITDVSTYSGDTTDLQIAIGQNGTGRAEILVGNSGVAVDANVYVDLISMDETTPFYILES
jgi:parallel beta-helix repeat protein